MNTLDLIIVFVIAFAVTPLVRKAALALGIIDDAGGDPLKIHRQPVVLFGGLAIVVAVVVGVFVCRISLVVGRMFRLPVLGYAEKIAYGGQAHVVWGSEMIWMIAGALLVFGVGLWDDIKEVRPRIRLLVHIIAGALIIVAGMRVNFIPIWWTAIPLTLIYIAGAINAFNVMDGMDGLCAGISLISCIGYFFLGLKSGNMLLYSFSAILFMALLGFLPYNFHPAKIFLGDAGSGFLGFMLGTMAVVMTSKPYDIANFIAVILVIGVPVFDMKLAILRRLIRRKPIFIGDRDHLYDLLLRKGWSQPKVCWVMYGAQLALVAVAMGIVYGR